MSLTDESDQALVHTELIARVESARIVVARRVDALMSAAYWEIGRRIVATEQTGKTSTSYGFDSGVLGDLPESEVMEKETITYQRRKWPKLRPADCVTGFGLRLDPSVSIKTIGPSQW